MIRVLHVIDASMDENALQALALLLRKGAGPCAAEVCCVDPDSLGRAAAFLPRAADSAPLRLWSRLHYAPRLAEIARGHHAGLIHAWGLEAAATSAARLPGLPLVFSVLNPDAASDMARGLRSLPKAACVAAGSQTIRSLLVRGGLAPDRAVVLRGGVDFAAISQARTGLARGSNSAANRPVILLHGPASRSGGQFFGLWACAILAQVHRNLRVILPYDSAETRRLIRFVEQIGMAAMLVRPSASATWEQLLSDADLFLAPAAGEICTEPIALAMAAGVPVVATAVRSVAELIADRHNGLLCKPSEPRLLAGRILTAWEDAGLRRKITDTARGQAFEVFSPRMMSDHYAGLYENLVAGRPAAEGIRDTAMVA